MADLHVIHQKPTQHCKAIILQSKKKNKTLGTDYCQTALTKAVPIQTLTTTYKCCHSRLSFNFFKFYFYLFIYFTLQYCIGFAVHQHASAMGVIFFFFNFADLLKDNTIFLSCILNYKVRLHIFLYVNLLSLFLSLY